MNLCCRNNSCLKNVIESDTIQVIKKALRNNNVSTNGNGNHVVIELAIFVANNCFTMFETQHFSKVTLLTNNLADYIRLTAKAIFSIKWIPC